MGPLERLGAWMNPTRGQPRASYSALSFWDAVRGGFGTASGEVVTPMTALRMAPVHRCVALISGNIANTPLSLRRRVDDRTRVPVDNTPLNNVLRRRPNQWQTPSQFRRQLQMHLLLHGSAYALKVMDSRGDVTSLIPLMADRVETIQNDDLTLRYRYQRKNGDRIDLAQRDVFSMVGMSTDGVTGNSVIGFAREAIGLASTTEKHGAAMFKNGASLGSVLSHPAQMGPEAQDGLRKSLEAYRGAENAGKALILEEGMKYEPIGMKSVDAQFLESRQFQDHHIFMFFGVPPHMAGDTSKAAYGGSSIEQQTLGFQAYTMEDWLVTWEEAINRDLIHEHDSDMYAYFNRAAVVRSDIKTRYGAYAIARQWGWLSPNDILRFEDMDPIPGGDDYSKPGNANAAAKVAATEGKDDE